MQKPLENPHPNIFRRLWNDSVFSNIIAAAIIGLCAIGAGVWKNLISIYDPLSAVALLTVFGLWILSIIIYFRKRHIDGDFVGVLGHDFPLYSRQKRKAALAGIVAIPIISVGGVFIHNYYKSLPARKIIVLVTEFDAPEHKDNRVTENIYQALVKAVKGYADLEVQLLREHISYEDGSLSARSIAKDKKASIILWGSYGETKENVQATVNFEVLESPVYFLSKTRNLSEQCGHESINRTITAPIEELHTFRLQFDISSQLSALTFLTVGVALHKAGDYDASIDYLTHALTERTNPGVIIEPADIYFYRGNAYLGKNDSDSAISDFDKVIQLQPGRGAAYNNRGLAYEVKGVADKALADFTEAINFASDICLACAYSNRGRIYRNKRDYARSVADFTKAIEINSNIADAYNDRGLTYSQNFEMDNAITDFKKAIEIDPNNACFLNNLGIALNTNNEFDKSIDCFNRAIKIEPGNANFLANRGLAYAVKQDYDKAFDNYQQAMKIDPNSAQAYHMRGHTYLGMGDTEKAIPDFTEAIRLDSKLAHLYLDRGQAYEIEKDYNNASADYKQALDLTEDTSIRNIATEMLKNLERLKNL